VSPSSRTLTTSGQPRTWLFRYPRQLSVGQRSDRACAGPSAVRCPRGCGDEPTASADVSVPARCSICSPGPAGSTCWPYLWISTRLEVVRRSPTGGGHVSRPDHGTRHRRRGFRAAYPIPNTRALLSSAPVAEYGHILQRFRPAARSPSPIDYRVVGRPVCSLATRAVLSSSPSCRARTRRCLPRRHPRGLLPLITGPTVLGYSDSVVCRTYPCLIASPPYCRPTPSLPSPLPFFQPCPRRAKESLKS